MISLAGVGKRFRLYDSPLDRVREWCGLGGRHRDFWALRGVDLEVPAGRTVGIVGPNGAGKSTLLKLVTGTLTPTTGSIAVDGRVAALLELGTGFHGEFTGRQNIWINGQLLGLSADEIAQHEREIVAFSELGRFIDQPLRTYSSGMVVRLGFAIAAAVNPQVLIIDEALSVGDARFSQKCIRRIRQFRESGATILFVSHDAHAVATLCDEAVLIDEGNVLDRGRANDVLEHYNALLAAKGEDNVEMRIHWVGADGNASAARRTGTFQAVVLGVRLLRDGKESDVFAPGDAAELEATVLFLSPVDDPTVGFLIRDRLGVDIYGTNTRLQGLDVGSPREGDLVRVRARFDMQLGDGDYSVTVAVHRDETHLEACYDWSDRAALFRVRSHGRANFAGRVRLQPDLGLEHGDAGHRDVATALGALFSHVPDPLGARCEAPSPFLAGFHAIESPEDGPPFRWTDGHATFVATPRRARLALALGVFGDRSRPVRVRLSGLLAGDLGEVSLSDERELAVFDLPAEAAGRADVFALDVSPTFRETAPDSSGRELGVAFFAARSLDPRSEVPPWHDTIPKS